MIYKGIEVKIELMRVVRFAKERIDANHPFNQAFTLSITPNIYTLTLFHVVLGHEDVYPYQSPRNHKMP